MITELSFKSGGEYDIRLLVHVKDNQLPVFADQEIYRSVIENNVPYEFWGLTTLWTENYMKSIYTTLFGAPFENPSGHGHPIHGAYRLLYMSLQWFAHEHPEYEYFWN
jgi:hypothetical protein